MGEEVRDIQARHQLETHERVCAERYGSLWSEVKELKEMIRSSDAASNARLTAMSNRLWALVLSVCGPAVLGVAILIFHLLTKKGGV